jgi:YD repeat-containing protein
VTFPDTSFETSGYDANGNLLTKTTRSGATITYTYDALNRVRTKTPQGELAVTYGYDLAGRATSVADSSGGLTYGYDTAGRNTSVLRSDSLLIQYGYDAAGNRTQLTWPDGYFVTYGYNQLNRLTSVRENGTTSLATYTLDGVSRRTALGYGNGVGATYGYAGTDVDLTSVAQAFPGSPVSFTYGYNKVHQRASQSVSDGRFLFHPAAASTVAYTPNAVNEYTAVDATSPTYDGNGNLPGDGVSTYTYDTENRLVTATGLGPTANYAYNPLGRRRSKTVDSVTTQYLADGDREIAEYDGAGTLLLRYVYGPGIGEPLAVVTPAGAHTFTHQDGLGSVIALSDDSRTVTDRYSYGAYGESVPLAERARDCGDPL